MECEKGVLLCVDDEMIVLTVLRETLLKEYGKNFIIETAESAEEGLEVLDDISKSGYELIVIISDWLMPGMRGDEFLIEVHKLFPAAIKIILSGQIDNSALQRAKDHAGLYAYLSKPWRRQNLIDTINSGIAAYTDKRS